MKTVSTDSKSLISSFKPIVATMFLNAPAWPVCVLISIVVVESYVDSYVIDVGYVRSDTAIVLYLGLFIAPIFVLFPGLFISKFFERLGVSSPFTIIWGGLISNSIICFLIVFWFYGGYLMQIACLDFGQCIN